MGDGKTLPNVLLLYIKNVQKTMDLYYWIHMIFYNKFIPTYLVQE